VSPRLRQELLDRVEHDFQATLAKPTLPLSPTPLTRQDLLLSEILQKIDRLNWLQEGPDSYDTIDETVRSTDEKSFDYSPFLLWALSVRNNEAAGGNNLLLRFTTTHGRVKQHRIVGNSTLDVDLKGGMGSEFRLVAREGTVDTIGIALLKWPITFKP